MATHLLSPAEHTTIMRPRHSLLRRGGKWPLAAVTFAVGTYCTRQATPDGALGRHPVLSWFTSAASSVVHASSSGTRDMTTSSDSSTSSWFSSLFSTSSPQSSLAEQEARSRHGSGDFYPPTMSPGIVDAYLGKQEQSWANEKRPTDPVLWYETNHVNANTPIEDRHGEYYFPALRAYFFGIYDGHSGWHCAETLRTRLPRYVALALTPPEDRAQYTDKDQMESLVEYLGDETFDRDCQKLEWPQAFADKQARIESGERNFAEKFRGLTPAGDNRPDAERLSMAFQHMDSDLSQEAVPDGHFNESLYAGISGAVAVGAYIKDDKLIVAGTGDCRAVLGTKTSSGYKSTALSNDHVAGNQNEVKRLNYEHPGESKTLVMKNRLLGHLMPLRSFGDVQYKWPKSLHDGVLSVVYGGPILPDSVYRTPPYLTAEPEVIERKLTSDDQFIILATDGLWDTVSNDKAVEIVASYLDDIEKGEVPEENSSTQLIRQALGEGDPRRLADMIGLPVKLKRNYHDDVTVTVVFFQSATNNIQPESAKL